MLIPVGTVMLSALPFCVSQAREFTWLPLSRAEITDAPLNYVYLKPLKHEGSVASLSFTS